MNTDHILLIGGIAIIIALIFANSCNVNKKGKAACDACDEWIEETTVG